MPKLFVKIIFALFGFVSLVYIVYQYGLENIVKEIQRSGFLLIFLTLTFIPTLFCYAISWLLATNQKKLNRRMPIIKKMYLFVKFTVISIAWNNMTPFFKIGGEPLKYMMLTKYLPKHDAMASTINYNVIHLLATAVSFIITALILILFYKLPLATFYFILGFVGVIPFALFFLSKAMHMIKLKYFKRYYFRLYRFISINVKLSIKRMLAFYKNDPVNFVFSLLFDLAGRFIEGATFFLAFYLIKQPVSFLSSSLLDVGRTFIDTAFFFVPFQIGAREEGVEFFMRNILMLDPKGFLTVVFLYRFVEIIWMVIGYIIWASGSNSSSESSV